MHHVIVVRILFARSLVAIQRAQAAQLDRHLPGTGAHVDGGLFDDLLKLQIGKALLEIHAAIRAASSSSPRSRSSPRKSG
ncbi:MAG: hypothetical protein MZW92_00435 [Comamonadaceae bacterium]|nr:hypothetical protein [Comamonadaceae bacterium]